MELKANIIFKTYHYYSCVRVPNYIKIIGKEYAVFIPKRIAKVINNGETNRGWKDNIHQRK